VGGAAGSVASSSNRFDIARDGQALSYEWTVIWLSDRQVRPLLWATNTSDPFPEFVDDEEWDDLIVEFNWEGLTTLATGQDYPLAGEGQWEIVRDGVWYGDVTFVGTGFHTAAIEFLFFERSWYGCAADPGAQTIRGTLRLTANTTTRLAGSIDVRVEGDVPCTENSHQFYDLSLTFDLAPGQRWTDQDM